MLFWRDRWIHGFAVMHIAPLVFAMVQTRVVNKRMVQQALSDNSWLVDYQLGFSFMAQIQLMHLIQAIGTVPWDAEGADEFTWPCSSSGSYTARSTYDRLCVGYTRSPMATCIWRSLAPLKCKLFAWLAMQHRIWTSDRRARHELQDRPSACYTCLQEEDNAEHILVQCVYTREVWHTMFDALSMQAPIPDAHDHLLDWWLTQRATGSTVSKRGFDTVVIAVEVDGTGWAIEEDGRHDASSTDGGDEEGAPN